MLTLYKYIHESLLDDEEDLLDNDDAIISQELNQLNKKSDHYSGDENIPIEIAGEGREEKKDYRTTTFFFIAFSAVIISDWIEN